MACPSFVTPISFNIGTRLAISLDAGELVEGEEDDPLTCSICGSGDATAANPIIKCDGEHETEVGMHLRCMEPPLDAPPEDEWFCAECQEKSLSYQVESIVDKREKMKRLRNGQRTGKPCVHYKVPTAIRITRNPLTNPLLTCCPPSVDAPNLVGQVGGLSCSTSA